LLATGDWLFADHADRTFKRVGGGFVVEDRDRTCAGEVENGRIVSRRQPTQAELSSLDFSWRVCKHVKSNAIVVAGPGKTPGVYETLGIGAGQSARVTAVQIACEKAAERARGASLSSDAFFPFPDNVQTAARAGVTAVVQPGGSKKDDDVIKAADDAGIAMIFTGIRHFRH
jgi:phosphoribosylaminoimidazolecarboxamide formyltransferase/IMP cyclohydrolase